MQQQEHQLGMEIGVVGMMGGSMLTQLEEDQKQQLKSEIASHPLCHQLLAAHVGCLRVATPIDHLPLIEAQLAQMHHILRPYQSHQHHQFLPPHEKQDLDNFLVRITNTHLLIFLVWVSKFLFWV